MFASGTGDKGLITLGGQPVIATIIDRLMRETDGIIINANDDETRFAQFNVPVVPDLGDIRDGPLSGIAAALAWAKANRPEFRAIATVTTDVPFLPLDLVSRLHTEANGGAAVATSGGRIHPTIGLWPVTLLETVQAQLNADNRRMTAFAKHTNAVEVAFPFSETNGVMVDPFFNLNTPDDITAAEEIWTRLHAKQKA
jgi:molybdenum cofactor guanylyltransferase